MKKLLNWLFNSISIGDKFYYEPDFIQETTLVATITDIKKNTLVYTVSLNGTPDGSTRIRSIKNFKKLYKNRLCTHY